MSSCFVKLSVLQELRSELFDNSFMTKTATDCHTFNLLANRMASVGHKGSRMPSICCRKKDLDDFPGPWYPEYGSLQALDDSVLRQWKTKKALDDTLTKSHAQNESLVALSFNDSITESAANAYTLICRPFNMELRN
eukprot:c23846_g1_i1 orf=193-603(+)